MEDNKSNDRERLESWYNKGACNASLVLDFGRKMPFGKYRGHAVYVLLVKHPRYMSWILENTGFKLNEDEEWLRSKVDLAIDLARADRLIMGLRHMTGLGGVDNIENPHWCVE